MVARVSSRSKRPCARALGEDFFDPSDFSFGDDDDEVVAPHSRLISDLSKRSALGEICRPCGAD